MASYSVPTKEVSNEKLKTLKYITKLSKIAEK